jgi:redox-sensing transcriptional repressor
MGERLGISPAQVRRDLMKVGYLGHPRHGYEVRGLLGKLDSYFDLDQSLRMVLVGAGNLGRAILGHFAAQPSHIGLEAAFDTDPGKTGRVLHGCRCHPLENLAEVVAGRGVSVGIVAVPPAAAQRTAELLVAAGVRGILNFAPVRLRVPESVFVEDIDVTLAVEKVGYFAKNSATRGRKA